MDDRARERLKSYEGISKHIQEVKADESNGRQAMLHTYDEADEIRGVEKGS